MDKAPAPARLIECREPGCDFYIETNRHEKCHACGLAVSPDKAVLHHFHLSVQGSSHHALTHPGACSRKTRETWMRLILAS